MTLNVEDKLAIHELLGRAAYGYDARDINLLTNCFDEQAQMSMCIGGGDTIGPFIGRNQIMDLMTTSMADQNDVRRHVISNIFFLSEQTPEIEVLSNLTLLATENGGTKLLSSGIYRDRVACEHNTWRIVHRHLDLDSSY